jgi:tRNA threonylcarbamoyladenosine biosynthesis protein TsaB
MIDARRDEVYIQRINSGETPGNRGYELDDLGNELPKVKARILNEETLKWMDVMDWNRVGFIGNANEKALRILNEIERVNPACVFSEAPQANMFAEEAAYKLEEAIFESVAYFEPYYLKDFVPGVSTKFKI